MPCRIEQFTVPLSRNSFDPVDAEFLRSFLRLIGNTGMIGAEVIQRYSEKMESEDCKDGKYREIENVWESDAETISVCFSEETWVIGA